MQELDIELKTCTKSLTQLIYWHEFLQFTNVYLNDTKNNNILKLICARES